jgi:uncharacterized phiE125 gp8 family phage protein
MSGALYLITPPTEDVVSLAEAKEQLRITSSSSDTMIAAIIKAAVAHIDPADGGWLGRAIRPQTWELRTNGFWPHCAIELRYPPLMRIDSVKYDDGDGVEQTLVSEVGYRVLGLGGHRRAVVAPLYNVPWPTSVRSDHESVRIRYTAGYPTSDGNSPPADRLPAPIKQAVLLMVKHLYGLGERNLFVSAEDVPGVGSRSFVVSENAAAVMKTVSEQLLNPYRVWE